MIGNGLLRQYALKLALLGASCLATVACLEVGMRYFGHHILPAGEWITIGKITQHISPYGFGLRPGSRQLSIVGGSYSVKATINSQGLRDDVHPLARRDGIRRILLLGDSFMFGTGVAQNETLAARLEQMIAGVEVINAGVPGYDLGMEYLYYRHEGVRFRPDLILIAFFVNDISPYVDLDVTYGEDGVPISYAVKPEVVRREESELPDGLRGTVSSWLRDHSLLFVLARDHLRTLGAERPRERRSLDAPMFAPFRRFDQDDPANPWPRVFLTLDRLRQEVLTNNARLAMLLIPAAPYQMSEEAFGKWLDWWELQPHDLARRHPQDRILGWCARSETDCLDMLAVFEKTDHAKLYLAHDLHWTAGGHLLAAEGVARFLADRGLLEPGSGP